MRHRSYTDCCGDGTSTNAWNTAVPPPRSSSPVTAVQMRCRRSDKSSDSSPNVNPDDPAGNHEVTSITIGRRRNHECDCERPDIEKLYRRPVGRIRLRPNPAGAQSG